MDNWFLYDILAFLVSLILTGILIPQILLIAFRKKLFDEPNERKIHKTVIPRLGGFAFTPSILFSLAFVAAIDLVMGAGMVVYYLYLISLPLCMGFCALMTMYLVGMSDDLIGVRYRAKFIAQIIAGVFLASSGLLISNIQGFATVYTLPLGVAWALTIIVTVFIINAINLIDGIDGLASGLSGIALLFYGLVFFEIGKYACSLIAFAALGTLLPFFYYNVFGNAKNHKKIFMGDTGALTTGIILMFLSLNMCNADLSGYENVNPIVAAFAPLIVPAFDVLRVYFHRIRNNKSPFLPDQNHIHHKLLALGWKQKIVMTIIILTSIFFIVSNVWLSIYVNVTFILAGDLILWTWLNIVLSKMIAKKKKAEMSLSSE